MTDFKKQIKDSLSLPQTKFPMKADLTLKESAWQKLLDKNNIYQQVNESNNTTYHLHDGPPYANGDIHIGHAVNKILKDIIAKSQRQNGFKTSFVPGWDCHGLPIELAVEKEIGKPNENLSKAEFRKACRKYAYKHIKNQRDSFKKLSILADWNNPYLTMNYKQEADTLRALGKIIENGHFIHSLKPINWCLNCESSLAEAEVEHEEITSCSMDVVFSAEKFFCFVVHTTTPWTLFANEAIAIGKDIVYKIVNVRDKDNGEATFVIAAKLVDAWLEKCGFHYISHAGFATGEELLEQVQFAINPLTGKTVPVVLSEHVSDDMGTGAVHIAPAYGADDMKVGKEYNLPITDNVSSNGLYTDGPLTGKSILNVNDDIAELLGTHLAWSGNVVHKYPHCWRHKTKTIFKATPQWFIKMDELSEKAIKECDNVEFIPERGKTRITSMLKDRPDWCVSRQRTWGVPIALYYHEDTKELHPNTLELLEEVAGKMDTAGIDVWDEYPTRMDKYIKCTDVLDVWFDSGVTHNTVMNDNPSVYLEGSDQHRGWFQTSLLTAVAMGKNAPFTKVITHGFALDEFGRKMSKSLGNVITPEELTSKYGVDVVRLWVATTDFTKDFKVSHQVLEQVSETYRRIRNTLRFLLANSLKDMNYTYTFSQLLEFDKFIISDASRLQDELTQHYNNFEFGTVVAKIHDFCSNNLGSVYLDVIKDRQYTMKKDSRGKVSAEITCLHLAMSLIGWITPILSYTADEAYQYIRPGLSVFLANNNTTKFTYEGIDWNSLLAYREYVISGIEKLRQTDNIGSSLEIDVEITVPSEFYERVKIVEDELKFLFITSSCVVKKGQFDIKVTKSVHEKCDRCWHYHETVKNNTNHICARCENNMFAEGEKRLYV